MKEERRKKKSIFKERKKERKKGGGSIGVFDVLYLKKDSKTRHPRDAALAHTYACIHMPFQQC